MTSSQTLFLNQWLVLILNAFAITTWLRVLSESAHHYLSTEELRISLFLGYLGFFSVFDPIVQF